LKEEENLSPDLIDNAFNNRKIEDIRRLFDTVNSETEVEIVNEALQNEVIIDIREEEKIKKDPLDYISGSKIEIPFYDINREFSNLDQSKIYLLFCDK
jgi:thiamine biosynthesis protein ThiI